MEIQVVLCKRRRNKVYTIYAHIYIYVTIKAKGLGQRFEDRRRGRSADRCQHNPEETKQTPFVVHLKIDEAMESRRSYKEVRSS